MCNSNTSYNDCCNKFIDFTLWLINLREGGTIHRIHEEAIRLPHRKRRTSCGWSIGQGVSSVVICADVASKKRCRKCFSADGAKVAEAANDDPIGDC